MEKRIFVAIGVSIAVLWLWAALAPRLFPNLVKKPQPVATSTAAKTATTTPSPATAPNAATSNALSAPKSAPAVPVTPISADRESFTEVANDHFTARFSNRGGQLVSFRLPNYKEKNGSPVDLVKQRPSSRTDYPFAIETADPNVTRTLNSALYALTEAVGPNGSRTLTYRYAGANGVSTTKTFRLTNDFLFEFDFSVTPAVPYRVVIGPGIRTQPPGTEDTQYLITGNGVVRQEGESEVIQREKGDRFQIYEGAEFIGIEDNYFLSAIKPSRAGAAILRRVETREAKTVRRELYAGVNALPTGHVSGSVFLGPKETKLLDRLGFGSVLQFGWFGVIARFLLEALVWINQFTKNYGFAIIVLTILIKVALYPLQHKSIVSMKKMQKVQPKMEAIKNKYKKAKSDPDQRQKMNVEMMKLYQVEGINPMSGCIPILLQMPILWGFYGLLSQAIELRNAPWILWIRDLSDKDPTYILPILMTATMFIQTYITPTTGDPMQRKIFLAMPIVFGWIFKEFPSGLVLYWLVQNILTIVQQMIMNKWWKDHPAELQKA
jgi:YidC/Oxa1 family membrane protein insertase